VSAVASGIGLVSPHLDDGALSCAGVLAAHAGSSMITVFAGGPPAVDPITGWEALSGFFDPGADIVGVRREEDRQASATVGASYEHLDHWDHQYRVPTYGYRGPTDDSALVRDVAADLEALISASGKSTWAMPLGLSHPDHQLTAAACVAVAGRLSDRQWLVYEDLPYAVYLPDTVGPAISLLRSSGFELEPTDVGQGSNDLESKWQAVNCYRSQLGPLGDAVATAVNTPEKVWRLVRP
jgi:LmbE family N-acetylglucosaminyl deacetylase